MRRIVLLVGLAFMVSAIVADAQVPGAPQTESPAIRQVGNTTILGDDPRNPGGNERITIKGDPTKVAAGTVTDEGIYFNYKEQDLINVIEAIAAVTGKNFNIDPGLNNVKVTVITHDPIPADMAMDVLENILASRGYALRETLDGFMIDVVSRDKERHKQEVFKGRELPPGYDRFSTHIVAVHNIDLSEDSAELANLLKSLGSDQASVDIYARTNTLIISDTSEGIRRMFALLEEIDIPGYETEMELITLEYTRAEVLATQINELLGEGEGGSPSSPTVPQPRRAVSPRSSTPLVIGAKEEILRIVPDERLNALIVVASENMMQQVLDLVERLDAPTDYESNNMHIYELMNADAKDVEETLNQLVSAAAPRKGSQPAGAQTSEIQPFEKDVSITHYEQTNALVILASPQDYKRLKPIIARLDVPQRQVHVSAIILDVAITDKSHLIVDSASVSGNDGFAMGNTAELASLYSLVDVANSLSSTEVAASTALALLGLGTSGGLTAGLYETIEIGGQEIPFVPFLIQAMETLTDVDVLSEPNLITVDNEEANIVVGQEVPYVSGTTRSLDASDNPLTGYSNIQREDIGVKLTVTPQISEGDNVALELDIEVSDIATNQIGDVNILGPTITKSNITNKVVVRDGATGIIGGLISDTSSRIVTQTPILGDIPLLGWLFRNRQPERRKHNLIVFISPQIVKEGADLDRLTEYKLEDFQSANIDSLFERGVIRKVTKKFEQRNRYRPTQGRIEKLRESDSGFNRGNL